MNEKTKYCTIFHQPRNLTHILFAVLLALLTACSDDSGDKDKPNATGTPSNQVDTDNDGIPDVSDPDIDNDGVSNELDRFPYDPSESKDTDGDTVGDNADKYPLDKNCSLSSDGNGLTCYSTQLGGEQITRHLLHDGIVYLIVPALSSIIRYDTNTQHYLEIIESTPDQVTSFAISTNNRLYLGYQSGQINYFDLASEQVVPFTKLDNAIDALESIDNLLFAQHLSLTYFSTSIQYVFDQDANLKDSAMASNYDSTYLWHSTSQRLYFKLDFSSKTNLYYEKIDPNNGTITKSGSSASVVTSSYNGNYPVKAPIRFSSDGSKILVGRGDIYSEDSLEWLDALGVSVDDAQWQSSGGLISVTNSDNHTIVERREADLGVIRERLKIPGKALGLYQNGNSYLAIVQSKELGLNFFNYLPSDDNDADGVENWVDDFPLDVAASSDSDSDGFPDIWNAGYSQGDSVSGLSLDAFPLDSACHLSQQGVNNCDIFDSMPSFIPDKVQVDENGMVYLLSVENQKIYRWSSSSASYKNPIILGKIVSMVSGQANQIRYSQSHLRLYIGYSSGAINFIDISGDIREHSFAKEPLPIKSLAEAGQFILTHGNLNYALYVGVRSVYSSSGVRLSSQSSPYTSESYDWSPFNNALYYNDSFGSYRTLRYSYIDQTDGSITLPSLTANNSEYLVAPPIRVSKDGKKVFNGAGHIYDAATLQWIEDLGIEPDDAQWTNDGELLTIKYNAGQTFLERRATSLANVVEQISYNGKPRGIFKTNSNFLIITQDDSNKFYFNAYQPSDDTDNDGVLNSSDDFPVDPAASLDSDRDGFPDNWHNGYTQADSDGLVLDAYPLDNACFALEQGDGTICDYSTSRPVSNPDSIQVDENGVVYMLDSQAWRISRWNAADGSYLDSIAIGWAFNLPQSPPTHMAYLETDRRIYLGYPNGAITYIDLTGDLSEKPLTRIRFSVESLAAAGNYVLTQSSDPKYIPGTTSYTISNAGEINSYSSAKFSTEFAWNSYNSRMYHFSDQLSPNDIYYQQIDQSTGAMFNDVNSPYHGEYTIVGPITLSPDGQLVMLGSGDIYSADTLSWSRNLGSGYLSAVWNNSSLVTVHVTGSQALLRYWDSVNLNVTSEVTLSKQVFKLLPYGNQVIAVSLSSSGVDLSVY